MRILIVDDDRLILKSLSHLLEEEGYTVFTAADGMKALDFIEKEDLDLIISDIMMPNLSGISLITLLEKNLASKVPVILISALDQSPAILNALGLSSNDCFVKPINYQELVKRVKSFEKKK